ncbi:MAG TPA: MBL fold metallo-hydrolase [Novosphingobium sp.]|nr:MBL fold metallo-hydrolase [Novosphingobium sp.]
MIDVGTLAVARVLEMEGMRMPLAQLGEVDALAERHRSWLYPRFAEPADNTFSLNFQTWVVDLDGFVLVVDPCSGNGRMRDMAMFHQLDTPFLERFTETGFAPERVDAVFCTHLHCDHCGWNTQLRDGKWVPTFPNARYYFVADEVRRWDTSRADYRKVPFEIDYNANVFEDSVAPIIAAGLAELITADHQIRPGLTVQPAHGHSVGHCALRVDCGPTRLWFTGDAFHHPLQVSDSRLALGGDDDLAMAIATRERLRETIAREGSFMMPAHFAAPHVGQVSLEGGEYRFVPLGD